MKSAGLLALNRSAMTAPAQVTAPLAVGQRRYVRRLSPIERCSLVLNAVHRYHLDAVVEGSGHIDAQDLQAAVIRAAAANPAIRVRLRGILGFCRWVDSGVAPTVTVVSDSAWDGKSSEHAEFMASRLDPVRGGPVSDILLVSCRDGCQRVVFRAVHAAIDGRAMLHWMQEVFRALRGENLLGSSSTLTDWAVQKQLQAQVTDKSPPLGVCLPVVAPAARPGPVEYLWRRIVIDHNVPHGIARAAVFLAGWARRQGAGEVGFTIPVDYRGLRTDEMGMGNLTGFVQMSIGDDDTPRSVMQHLNQRIRDLADCRMQPVALVPWLPLALLVKMFVARLDALLYSVGQGIPTGGIVSMGLVRAKDFVCPGFQPDHVYGIPGAVGKLNVVLVNYGSTTIVSFAAPKAYNDIGQLDDMIEAFRQHFMSGAAHQRGSKAP